MGLAILRFRRHSAMAAQVAAAGPPAIVTIVEFSKNGERTGTVQVPKIVKTDDEWRAQLKDRSVYEITRKADTEIAFSGEYWNLHDKGLFRCVCCETALFSSETKFDSGTGWPSFWAPIAKENIETIEDHSFGITRMRWRAAGATPTLGTCSTMGRRRPVCATASIRRRWYLSKTPDSDDSGEQGGFPASFRQPSQTLFLFTRPEMSVIRKRIRNR